MEEMFVQVKKVAKATFSYSYYHLLHSALAGKHATTGSINAVGVSACMADA